MEGRLSPRWQEMNTGVKHAVSQKPKEIAFISYICISLRACLKNMNAMQLFYHRNEYAGVQVDS